jgi:hypothetical protein
MGSHVDCDYFGVGDMEANAYQNEMMMGFLCFLPCIINNKRGAAHADTHLFYPNPHHGNGLAVLIDDIW